MMTSKPPRKRRPAKTRTTVSTPPVSRQVIRSVESSSGEGETRLVLQSVCGSTGLRYIRALWEYKGNDGEWYQKDTAPEFNASVWTNAITKAAVSGMLSSEDYKNMLVRLAKGLDASKSPTQRAFVRFTGSLSLEFDIEAHGVSSIDEVMVYESLSKPPRDLTVTQSRRSGKYRLVYEVTEEIHYTEAISRLPADVRKGASNVSLEVAVGEAVEESFLSLFGDPGLPAAGFSGIDGLAVDYKLSVL